MDRQTAFMVAALLTVAAMGGSGTGGNFPPDPTLTQGGTRSRNLQTWETFRVFYAAACGAAGDTKDWPGPNTAAATGATGPTLPVAPPA